MTSPEAATRNTPKGPVLRFELPPGDAGWERERDACLAEFIAQQLALVDQTGCRAEKALAAGVDQVFQEWNEKRALDCGDNEEFAAQISALGWALRCIAHHAWRTAPGWSPTFHPQAASSQSTPETPI